MKTIYVEGQHSVHLVWRTHRQWTAATQVRFASSMSARAPGCSTLVGKPLYAARNGGRTPVRCSLQQECSQNGPPATTTPSPSDRHDRGWRGETGRSYKLSPHVRSAMTTRWENDTCYYNTAKVTILDGARTEVALLFFILPHINVRHSSHEMQSASKHTFFLSNRLS